MFYKWFLQCEPVEYDAAKTNEWCVESEDVGGRNDCSSDADCLEMGRKMCDADPGCFGIAWYEYLLEQPLKLCRSREMEPKGDGWHSIMKTGMLIHFKLVAVFFNLFCRY